MKKIFEKHGVVNCVGALMDVIAFILFIVAAFVDGATADMVLKVVGLVLFVVAGMMMSISSKEHSLAKSIFVLVLAGVIASWMFPGGQFQGADFAEGKFARIGLADFGFMFYYSVYFLLDKIPFLVVLTGFYGVLSKISGYQKLVGSLADKLSKHPIVTSVVMSVILFVLTSLISQTFVVLVFIPFFISILVKMGMDKLTAFAITFGSALVGILGCTYGTDTLAIFNSTLNQDIKVGLSYRFIIAAVSLVLYNFFIVMRVRKIDKDMKKNTKNNTIENDPFAVEKVSGKEKTKMLPAIIVLALTAIIVILGYINWNTNFGIKVFDEFHEWLVGLEAGKDFNLISYILGANANALGNFKYVFIFIILLVLVSALLAFLYKMSFNEYIESFYEGTKKMFKPLLCLLGVNLVFTTSYIAGQPIASVYNWILNLVEGFNPFITSIVAFISSLFQVDFGYVAYTVGSFATTVFADNFAIAHTIFTSMYGIVQIFMPTSMILVTGLALTKVSYKEWFKYIWLFVVGMIIILLVLFTVVTYI